VLRDKPLGPPVNAGSTAPADPVEWLVRDWLPTLERGAVKIGLTEVCGIYPVWGCILTRD